MVEGTGGARGAAPAGRAEAPAHLIQGDGRPSSEEAVCEEPAATFRVPGSVAGSAPHFPSRPPTCSHRSVLSYPWMSSVSGSQLIFTRTHRSALQTFACFSKKTGVEDGHFR